MSALVDTPILIHYLRGHGSAAGFLERQRSVGVSALMWHPVDDEVAEEAGALGRRWLPSHSAIDGADLAIAATTLLTGSELLTLNVRHFPMFADLRRLY